MEDYLEKKRNATRVKEAVVDNKTLVACMRKHRLNLGLSYNSLAQYFDVTWGTVRNWELTGKLPRKPQIPILLQKFISGCFDKEMLWLRENHLENNYHNVKNLHKFFLDNEKPALPTMPADEENLPDHSGPCSEVAEEDSTYNHWL